MLIPGFDYDSTYDAGIWCEPTTWACPFLRAGILGRLEWKPKTPPVCGSLSWRRQNSSSTCHVDSSLPEKLILGVPSLILGSPFRVPTPKNRVLENGTDQNLSGSHSAILSHLVPYFSGLYVGGVLRHVHLKVGPENEQPSVESATLKGSPQPSRAPGYRN